MKNKILVLASIFAIITIATFNITITQTSDNPNDLSLINLKAATANAGEYAGWSNFWQGQGFYKDEKAIRSRCSNSESESYSFGASYGPYSVSGSYSYEEKNPPERFDIRCTNGNSNCTPVDC